MVVALDLPNEGLVGKVGPLGTPGTLRKLSFQEIGKVDGVGEGGA